MIEWRYIQWTRGRLALIMNDGPEAIMTLVI